MRKATGVTVNDVVLAMSGAALRRYLAERGALPNRPLVAMVPVSLRDAGAEALEEGLHDLGQATR